MTMPGISQLRSVHGAVVDSFIYRDASGTPIARIDRWEPGRNGNRKEFFPYLATGAGSFASRSGLNGKTLPLYRLGELQSAIAMEETVFFVEGEGKGDKLGAELRMAERGGAVTTRAGGASSNLTLTHLKQLLGAHSVVVIADSDSVGRQAARKRSHQIADFHAKCDVRMIDLFPDRDDGSDVANWFDEQHTVGELFELVCKAGSVKPGRAAQNGAATTIAAETRKLETVRLSDVEPESVEWIWNGRIPRGKVSLLVGDPGAGKSFASLAIAAGVTQGRSLPDDDAPRESASVLLWNGEDGLEDTIRVRAETLGVDLDRLHAIRGTADIHGNRSPFSLLDVDRLDEAIRSEQDVSLVIIDPLAALLAGVDTHRDAEVRSALQPLSDLARNTGVAVLCVLHMRKSEAERAVYRVAGSIGFVALARSVLLVGVDQANGRRAIAPLKSNLSVAARPIEFQINDAGRWLWGSTAEDLGAEHLLRSTSQYSAPARRKAEKFLEDALADGARPALEVEEEARNSRIPIATLKRARKRLGVISERLSTAGLAKGTGRWMLSLTPRGSSVTPGEEVDSLDTLSRFVRET